jgi:hypothetical protein
MRTFRIACAAAALAVGLSAAAHADEWNKLTYLTFSGPVTMPGITLPAGTYRFQLMDPESGRRVIRVSDKDGSTNYGIFLSIADQKMEPSSDPVVVFREMPKGIPQAIKAWFYPGETYGYEFVYPHDQAMKIAKATHEPVLAMKQPASTTTESDRVAAMRGAAVGHIDESGKPVSSDERLKTSSTKPNTTTASAGAAASRAPSPSTTTAQSTTTPKTTTAPRSNTTNAVGTSGAASGTAGARRLPRTASSEPLLALLSVLAIAGAAGVRAARKALA